jgi:O-antigen ligase
MRVAAAHVFHSLTLPPSVRLTVGLILTFFAAVYPLLPTGADVVQETSVRFAVSVVCFSLGTLLVLRAPVLAIPVLVGLLPILLVLRTGGAIHGRGVDTFYLLVALTTWRRLPSPEGRKVMIKGRWWIGLFLVQCGIQVLAEALQSGEFDSTLAVQGATFYIVVYVLSLRISRETLHTSLYGLATACSLLLVWLIGVAISSVGFTVRLGDQLGVNPNLAGQLGIYLTYAVFFLLLLGRDRRVTVAPAVLLALGTTGVLLSQGRLAAVQVAVVLLLVVITCKLPRLLMLTAVAAAILVLALMPGVVGRIHDDTVSSNQYERLTRLTLGGRDDLNTLAWNLALEHPLFGVGPGQFQTYSLGARLTEETGEGSYHHNAITGTAAEFGFLGLGTFLLWFVAFLRSRPVGSSMSVLVVAFGALAMAQGLTHGLFLDAFGSLPLCFVLAAERFGRRSPVGLRRAAARRGALPGRRVAVHSRSVVSAGS